MNIKDFLTKVIDASKSRKSKIKDIEEDAKGEVSEENKNKKPRYSKLKKIMEEK